MALTVTVTAACPHRPFYVFWRELEPDPDERPTPVVAATNGVRTAMLQLFRPMHFAQLANYLIRAQRRRFAVGGMDLMVAQAAEPPASMVATSPSRSASCSGGYSSDSGQGDDDDAWSDGA
jgi:hypothetical protein